MLDSAPMDPTQSRLTRSRALAASDTAPMTVSEWLTTLIVLAIPVVGIVMYFVWAFSERGNITRRNFCRASLLLFAVFAVIFVVLGALSWM